MNTFNQHLRLTLVPIVVHQNLRHTQPDGGKVAARVTGTDGFLRLEKVLDKLNEMVFVAIDKMDFEAVRCDSEERTYLTQLALIEADIIMLNHMASRSAATAARANSDEGKFCGL